jgi:hypothetical protein
LSDLTFDLEPAFLRLYEQCRAETMTSIERMYAIYQAVEHVVRAGLPGDFAECGVWRGGSVMMMALAAAHFGDTSRAIHLYDTFAGMTEPSAADVQAQTGEAAADVLAAQPRDAANPFWALAPRETVEANLRRTGYPMDRFRLVEGDVLATLPAAAPPRLALLRLDTDWYASTRHELECLYPHLASGGVLIIDDYGYWAGSRKAVDDFFAHDPRRPLLHRTDFTGRVAVKR